MTSAYGITAYRLEIMHIRANWGNRIIGNYSDLKVKRGRLKAV